jgi:hypothetical protein
MSKLTGGALVARTRTCASKCERGLHSRNVWPGPRWGPQYSYCVQRCGASGRDEYMPSPSPTFSVTSHSPSPVYEVPVPVIVRSLPQQLSWSESPTPTEEAAAATAPHATSSATARVARAQVLFTRDGSHEGEIVAHDAIHGEGRYA